MITDIELADARRIAADWHSGQWSALYAFASTGTIQSDLAREVEKVVSECEHRVADPAYAQRLGNYTATAADMLEDARALLAYVTQPIVSVWSAHGHHFLESDGYASCLRCGGEWELIHDQPEDPSHGAYVASNGDAATECEGVDGPGHGEDRPELTEQPCNCLFCAS